MSKLNTLSTFVHVPKTGGVTLHDVISRNYSVKQRLHIDHVKIPLRAAAELHARQSTPFNINGHIDVKDVMDIPGNYLFTFLRHPIDRVISHYNFLKQFRGAKYYEVLNQSGGTIEKFYALKVKKDFDNCFVRYYSGRHELECGMISKHHYEEALHNLKTKFHFFGLQEFYDESLIMLANELRWHLPVYRKKNVTEGKEAVSEETVEFLRDQNRWDLALYEEAKQLFTIRMSEMTLPDKNRLNRLRVLNKLAALYPF